MNPQKTPAKDPAKDPATGGATGPANTQAPGGAVRSAEAAGQRACDPANARSRLLKGAYPLQSGPRPSAVGLRYSLGRRLTDRDREIAIAVHRHRVLLARHIADMFFSTRKRGLVRLRTLADLGVLDRFRILARTGEPNEYHYVLGRVGASIVAAEHGGDPDAAARRWRGDTALVLARGQRLAHAIGISGFYAGLAAEARQGRGRLAEWMTEAESARWSEGVVRPDGLGVWAEDGREVEFFLEYDRGTETLARLAAKLDGYRRFEEERGASAWVLFAFTSPGREARARSALHGADVPTASAVLGPDDRPSGAVWSPVGAGGRLRLAELADAPKPHEAEARAAQGSLRAWRFARSPTDDPQEAPIDQP